MFASSRNRAKSGVFKSVRKVTKNVLKMMFFRSFFPAAFERRIGWLPPLAFWTKMGPALPDHDLLHRRLAIHARFAFAAVHAMQYLKIAALAVGIHVIRDR